MAPHEKGNRLQILRERNRSHSDIVNSSRSRFSPHVLGQGAAEAIHHQSSKRKQWSTTISEDLTDEQIVTKRRLLCLTPHHYNPLKNDGSPPSKDNMVYHQSQILAMKQARNTLAARKSRERKAKRLKELEERVAKLEAERDYWKRKALDSKTS